MDALAALSEQVCKFDYMLTFVVQFLWAKK